jgi:multicomponent Na+:H+ antiporter subunit F
VTAVLIGCIVGLAAAFTISLFRIAHGPTPADRATGSDVSYLVVVSVLAIAALLTGEDVFVDVVLVGGVVGFLATLSFAWLVQRRSS